MSSVLTTMAAGSQVAESPDTQVPQVSAEISELNRLLAEYWNPKTSKIYLAKALLSYRQVHNISQQELARRMDTTAGRLHQLESLLTLPAELVAALEDGRLTFKEGRSLADLRLHPGRCAAPDHDRQREIAAMFLSGRVSSVYVEPVVWAAKADPSANIDEILRQAVERVKGGRRPPKHILQLAPPPLKVNVPTPTELKTKIINLAADLTLVQMHPYCETEMLGVRSLTRILIDRLKAAGVYENGQERKAKP